MAWVKSSFECDTGSCVEVEQIPEFKKSSYSADTSCVEVAFKKSSFSQLNYDCVEVAVLDKK